MRLVFRLQSDVTHQQTRVAIKCIFLFNCFRPAALRNVIHIAVLFPRVLTLFDLRRLPRRAEALP
jgi:hypothetical protein